MNRLHPGTRAPDPTILFVGTYERRKRGKLLAEIFERQIRRQLPASQLWMVSEDAPEGEGVRVFGRISDDELAELYRQAWVFCLPSTYEGFGIPYVEAMASGCAVVSSPNPGSCRSDRRRPVRSPAEDDELGNAILHLLRNPLERDQMSKEAIVCASEFDLARVAADYERLYLELIQRRKRS